MVGTLHPESPLPISALFSRPCILYGLPFFVCFLHSLCFLWLGEMKMCIPKSANITTHLKSFHWLPVKVRSIHKIACLCYHCHSSTAPSYVTDMLQEKPSHSHNTRSSSYTMPLLNRPTHGKATLDDGSFSIASSVWNSSI